MIEQIRAVISPDQLDPAVQAIRSDPKLAGADQAARIEVLTYTAAALNVQLVHERTYAAIFGSQLQLLAQMNVDVGVPPSVARQVYDAAKTANPEVYRNYTFEQWIGFLRNSGLISIAPKGNYVLTPWGRGLLRYIVDRHLSVNKPF